MPRSSAFEAQTLLPADVQNKVHKADDQVKTKLAPAEERENRIKDRKARWEGLRFKGEGECSYQSYDVLSMMEKDTPLYLSPGKFPTRSQVLVQKKATKEVSIDQSALVIKDRAQELLCSTSTELETVNAMKRRALAFDVVKACSFHSMNSYHAELFDYLHQAPPPGYSSVSLTQVVPTECVIPSVAAACIEGIQ